MTDPSVDAVAAWGDRVRANREQVDRLREVPDGADFYARVTSMFRADPRRKDEPVLDLLLALARPQDTWLDIGAGGGRYALPLALAVREVIAIDPSAGMLAVLRELMQEHGIANVRVVEGRWPPDGALAPQLGPLPIADVALIAHVGYDIEAIGPFLDAMEAAARRTCVAVLMDSTPASVAAPFWPPVHGEPRVPLPAMPEFVGLLRARGREPHVAEAQREPRRFESREALEASLRRQLWIADGGEKERRYRELLDRLVVEDDGHFGLAGQGPLPVRVVTWSPPR
ncbi:MAG: class I SAM-dependent methyltransferase [Chloroflexi bacterium]|nr:MAG: class I SAM-dependent methyltransferase [Chloroflexota bacterium]